MYEPAAGAALRPWRKILYEKQPFEDNYVDESFLEGLVKNANFRRMEFWHIVPKTLAIVQQLSALCVIYVAFTHTLLVRCARRATRFGRFDRQLTAVPVSLCCRMLSDRARQT